MRLDAERLEHIPSGWNQPDGICPVIQDGPVRAFPIGWNCRRFHPIRNRSSFNVGVHAEEFRSHG